MSDSQIKSFTQQLKTAGVDAALAKKAAKDLAKGKTARDSTHLANAYQQIKAQW